MAFNPEAVMAHVPLSLVISKHTTSAEIACFLRQAGEKVSRPDAGLRARQGAGADGKCDGTVVLYLRDRFRPRNLDERVALLVDDVKAFFNAKEEYRLAAVTLLERAEAAKFHEAGITDETRLCTTLANALDGKCLAIGNMRRAWREAFPEVQRLEHRFCLDKLRNDIAAGKGLPATRQKNGQAPGQVVERGLSELSYLESLLSVSPDYLDRFARGHLLAMFRHLGLPMTDESLCHLKDAIASVIHAARLHEQDQFAASQALSVSSAADVEHVKTAIEFARTWINGLGARPQRSDLLRYSHVLALDYLACMLLMAYQPESEESGRVRQLLAKISGKKPGDNYRSVTVALEPEFVDWLSMGRPAYAFFAGKQADRQWYAGEVG